METTEQEIKKTAEINNQFYLAGVAGHKEKVLQIIVDYKKGKSNEKETIKLIEEI